MADEPVPLDAESKPGDLRGVLAAGTMLRGYELKSILGQGAFGITYRARDLTLGRDVAIKEYLPTTLALREGRTTVLPRSPEHAEQFNWGRERFLDEARTLAKLDRTPAIVRVHDFLEDNGTAYMVMGLVEGENLNKRLLREGRLTPEAVERLLLPLLDGLEEVHGIGFLHRDIKPANVMVDARGRPTLIDFGAARAAMAGRSTTMTAIFTPGYAAAEQYTSAALGPWTDIYGVAATMAHAITGKIPPSSIERIIKDTYVPLSELKPEGFSPELLAGIDAGMARQVDDRPQSIAEWRHVLRTGEHRASSQEVTQVEYKPRRRTRKSGINVPRPLLWGAVAAAVIVLAGGGWLAFTAGSPPTVVAAATSLSAEQLEQALAERRKADTLAAEKRKLEEEARQKAQADAEAKRQAESELEQARQARQKAEQELAELKARIAAGAAQAAQQDQAAVAAQREAEAAAQRKAEADAAALRQAEEDAKKRVEAEAEAKRQADEALARVEAERQKAEQEARAKAEAEQAALRQSSEDAQRKAAEAESVRKAEQERVKAEAERARAEADRQKAEADAKVKAEAEAAEKALRLDQPARERVQLALSSLGFDTRGTDGIFGPRSREMISAWQKARNQPSTGFLNAAQQEAMLKEAAPALSKHDEQKKADEEAKARLAASTAVTASSMPASTSQPSAAASKGPFDGRYSGGVIAGGASSGVNGMRSMTLDITGGTASGTIDAPGCGVSSYSATVSSTGDIKAQGTVCETGSPFSMQGRVEGDRASLAFDRGTLYGTARAQLSRTTSASSLAPSPATATSLPSQPPPASAAQPTNTAYDGTYSAIIQPNAQGRSIQGGGQACDKCARLTIGLRISNGRGSGTVDSPGCSTSLFSLTISPTGQISGQGYFNCAIAIQSAAIAAGPLKIEGSFKDGKPDLFFSTGRSTFDALLSRGAVASTASPSPDGLWRGTYACTDVSGSRLLPSFTLDLNLKLVNGISSGGGVLGSPENARTVGIEVAVNPPNVTVTRSYFPPLAGGIPISRHSMPGQYDGTSIRASGTMRQGSGTYDCTLALTRVP